MIIFKRIRKWIASFSRSTELKFLMAAWIIVLAYAEVPGLMEAKYIPVIDNFTTQIIEHEDGKTSDIFLGFDKLRPDCEFRSIQFYMRDEHEDSPEVQYIRLRTVFGGQEQGRWEGRHDAVGPWTVRASAADLVQLVVRINHRCHLGYETITKYQVTAGYVEKL